MPVDLHAPASDTEAYKWWALGARDEYALSREGLSQGVIEMKELLVSLARLHQQESAQELLCSVAWIVWSGVSWRQRLSLARRSVIRRHTLTWAVRKWKRRRSAGQ